MTVTRVEQDPVALTMTITSELVATPERAWALWSDPEQFCRWWGPPGFPTTSIEHDVRTGGRIRFSMSGDGSAGYEATWAVLLAEPPLRLELRDADVDEHGVPNDGNSITRMIVTFDPQPDGRTAMTVHTHFDSLEGMEQTVAGGFDDGMRMVLAQIDELLADSADAIVAPDTLPR